MVGIKPGDETQGEGQENRDSLALGRNPEGSVRGVGQRLPTLQAILDQVVGWATAAGAKSVGGQETGPAFIAFFSFPNYFRTTIPAIHLKFAPIVLTRNENCLYRMTK